MPVSRLLNHWPTAPHAWVPLLNCGTCQVTDQPLTSSIRPLYSLCRWYQPRVPMSGDGGGGTAEAGCPTEMSTARTVTTNSINRFMVLVLSIPREDVSHRPPRAL